VHSLVGNIMPILFLIGLGSVLRRVQYFEEVAIQRVTNMVANLLVPCVIFTTFLNLNIRPSHFWLALSFATMQCVLLAAGWIIYKAFHLKRRFFPFFHCAFAFGFMAIPLFSTVFGEENMDSLVAIGLGQEVFVGLIFLTTAKFYLKNEKTSLANVGRTLLSPLFVMIFLALAIKFLDMKDVLLANVISRGCIDAIAKLGSVTSVLTMLIVGYRIRLTDRAQIRESFTLVGVRYGLTFSIGYLFKFLIMDRFADGNVYFDYAFFTMLSQHGSVVLTAFVGEYGSKEDMEIASNAFVINALVGIAMYLVFVFRLSVA
jgi:predicted permease